MRLEPNGSFERTGTRLNILVVNSLHFIETLEKLGDDMSRILLFREEDE